MELVSSDTNVWIDFGAISRLHLPFLLPFTYIMYRESIETELLSPLGFRDDLLASGLLGVDITIEEFFFAERLGDMYPKLSVQDRIALAIAKQRSIILMTGDKALRKAAASEGVPVIGTLGVLDKLYEGNYISVDEYGFCLNALLEHCGMEVRLPQSELKSRIECLETSLK